MSSYSNSRLRDTPVDPVHGQNPDYYAETSSNAPGPKKKDTNLLYPGRPNMSSHQQDSGSYRGGGSSTASRRRDSDEYSREEMHLEPYPVDRRGRSVPPPSYENAMLPRGRRHSRSDSASSSSTISLSRDRDFHNGRQRGVSPMSRARDIVSDNFSAKPAGLGAGLLGAVIGGVVANQASAAAAKRKHKNDPRYRRSKSQDRAKLLTTLAGAVVGGLGANVVATRVQHFQEERRESAFTGRGMGGGGGNWQREDTWESYRSRGSSRGSGSRGVNSTRGLELDDEDEDYREKGARYLKAGSERSGGSRRREEDDDDDYDFVYEHNDNNRRRSHDYR